MFDAHQRGLGLQAAEALICVKAMDPRPLIRINAAPASSRDFGKHSHDGYEVSMDPALRPKALERLDAFVDALNLPKTEFALPAQAASQEPS